MVFWHVLRLLLRPVPCLLVIITLSYLICHGSVSKGHDLWMSVIQSHVQRGIPVDLESNAWSRDRGEQGRLQPTSDNHLTSLYSYDIERPNTPYIGNLLQCPLEANKHTSHVRLAHTPFHNISLFSAEKAIDPKLRYFNPTFIPLPSWSPYPYLLVSRLVTTGLHQESHICFAELCLPTPRPHGSQPASIRYEQTPDRLPVDAKKCTESNFEILGANGGLRCATPPQRLNIPPTPALRCEGSWSAFPDIPGFHDPRVFWSGKGEPLIIVNSGSQYGCIGLWIVDLRAVSPDLASLLKRGLVARKMSYPYLTEIMRAGRGAVEKNWVVFFPKEEEAWVQFDIMGHGAKAEHNSAVSAVNRTRMAEQSVRPRVHENGNGSETNTEMNNSPLNDNVLSSNSGSTSKSRSRSNALLESSFDVGSFLNDANSQLNKATASILNESTFEQKLLNISTTFVYGDNSTGTPSFVVRQTRPDKLHENSQASATPTYGDTAIIPSRSLAKLFGSGYTTSNITSPSESRCFNSSHIFDSLGNQGHWHQGSNSLRLVLCHRPGYHQRTSTQPESGDGGECSLTDENEDQLVGEGRVVHFMVMHRKFTNEMKLPMRYERYFLVWEARWPFRVVSLSKYPILFSEEAARPWTVDENWPHEVDTQNDTELRKGRQRWQDVYFTYTPSITWAWRRGSDEDEASERRLGTGYLEDEVLVGIGMDDTAQVFVRVGVKSLLSCQRLCPDFEDHEH